MKKRRRQKLVHPGDPYGAFLSKNRDGFPQAWRNYLSEELRLRKFHQEPLTIGKGGLS